MADWNMIKVKDIGRIVTGKTPKTAEQDNYGGDIPFLTPSDDMGLKYVVSTGKTLTKKGMESVKGAIIPTGSVCVSCIGSDLGKVVITTGQTVTNQQINSIIVNTEHYDIDFVYYAMLILGKELNYHSKTSTAVPIVNKSAFSNYEIACPSLTTQKKIGKILSSLDAKIDENRKINKNLATQLQLIFSNSFFSEESSAWPKKKLGEYLSLERGLSYKGKYLSDTEGVPMVNLGNILPNSVFRPEKLKFYTGEYKPKVVVKPGDIVVANTDLTQAREVLGSAIIIPDLGYPTIICSHHISIVRNCRLSKYFLFGMLNSSTYRERVVGFATGTTVLALPNEALMNCEFYLPPEAAIAKFDAIAGPIHRAIEQNRVESEKLARLRDELITRLISGQVDVSEVLE